MPTQAVVQIEHGRLAGARRDFAVEQEQICPGEGPDRCQDPVDRRDVLTRRRFKRGISREGEEECQAEMDRTRFGVVEDEDAENERKGRGIPELEQRPGDRHRENDPRREPGRFSAPGIRFGDELFEIDRRSGRTGVTYHVASSSRS